MLLPQCNGGTAFAKACGETVNKIMDALKEERTSDCNAAAMREALIEIRDICQRVGMGISPLSKRYKSQVCQAVNQCFRNAVAALAAPPRNCDRFGGDIDKLREACARERGLNPEEDFPDVFPDWLLAPSTEKKGGAK